MAESIMFQSVI